jgi:anti-sigma factor RsiW
MTAGLYCRARIDRRTIRRHDADSVDASIAPGFLGLRGFRRPHSRGVAVFKGNARGAVAATILGLGAAVVVGGRPQPRRAVEGRVRTSIEQTMPVFFASAIRGVGDWQQRLSPSKM